MVDGRIAFSEKYARANIVVDAWVLQNAGIACLPQGLLGEAYVSLPVWQDLASWMHSQVHAEGEAEHAAIGHAAVVGFVPAPKQEILRRAMMDHDRDFAVFYNTLADMLE